jgi:hypothetical protein
MTSDPMDYKTCIVRYSHLCELVKVLFSNIFAEVIHFRIPHHREILKSLLTWCPYVFPRRLGEFPLGNIFLHVGVMHQQHELKKMYVSSQGRGQRRSDNLKGRN